MASKLFLPAKPGSRPVNGHVPSLTVTVERSSGVSVSLPSLSRKMVTPPRPESPVVRPSPLVSLYFVPETLNSLRLEERRVGKEGRSRGSPDHYKKRT